MKKRTKNYILFIYDFFVGEREHLPHVIPLRLLPLTEGDIKFIYGDYGMICNIETKRSFKKVKKLVRKSLRGEVDQYFLLEQPKEMNVYMPSDMMKGLFGPFSKVETVGWKPKKEQLDNLFNKVMDELYPNDLSESFKLIRNNPTLDQLLDKISNTGIDSLSDYEKELLKKYSK
jgi:hypothetical protein